MLNLNNGDIVSFKDPHTGLCYDGVVWRVLKEGNSQSLFIRFVDRIDEF